jgi:hypothetical protein
MSVTEQWSAGVLMVAAVMGLFSPASADDTWTPTNEGWSRYRNERFGTLAEVPLHVFKLIEPPPANGDGRAFASRDGAQLTISGSYGPDVVVDTFAGYKAWLLENAELDRITYKAEGKTWLVLSGVRGQNIVYQKVVEGCGAAHTLHIEYSASKKDLYDPVAVRMARSLSCKAKPLRSR